MTIHITLAGLWSVAKYALTFGVGAFVGFVAGVSRFIPR
jgi:hypothetical protein